MKPNTLRLSIVVVVLAGILSGCLKSVDPPAPTPLKAYMSIMHLAPNAPAVDVFFNDTKVSNFAFPSGTVTTTYNPIEKGVFAVKFKKAGSDSLVADVSPAAYDSLNFYTLFIHNQQVGGAAMVARIKDDFTNLTADKPYFRFFHASPNTAAVDLYINNVKIESNRVTADNTFSSTLNAFKGTTAGMHTVIAKLAGTDTEVATLNGAQLQAGNAYTFYLKGLTGGTGTTQLSLELLRASN